MSILTGRAGRAAKSIDDRYGGAPFARKMLNKVFPDHWSFLLGEIALYSFIILILTGTYLAFFFNDGTQRVVYNGGYAPLRGLEVSAAYASTIDLSFDVRAGLVVRQMHHWAALLFVASIIVHMCRVFFTGAFRKPRELNWHIGVGLLTLGLLEGFAGYSLPDDLLSGTGLRIAYSIAESIPVAGTWLSILLFGGEFPGHVIIERLYIVHVLVVPGLLLGLITAHLGLLVRQKHTQFPGPGRREDNVVGVRVFPTYAANGGAFFFMVFGVVAALGGLAQINPIWLYGTYNPANVTAGSQPDWYIGFLDGSSRLMPRWDIVVFHHTIPAIFWVAAFLPGLMFAALAMWPSIEARMTGDREIHHLLERPRDNPKRTGIGAMALTFYLVLFFSGGNDIPARIFNVSLNLTTWIGRVALLLLPPTVYAVTKRLCLALQAREHDVVEHGIETGIVRQLPSGEYIEVHAPLPAPAHAELANTYDHDLEAGTPERRRRTKAARRAITGFLVHHPDDRLVRPEDDEPAADVERPRELVGRPSAGKPSVGKPSAGKPAPPDRA